MHDPQGRFIPATLISALRDCASHSLRHLEFGGETYDPPGARNGTHYIGSLKMFTALETVKIGATMLIKPESESAKAEALEAKLGQPCKLVNVCPSSIVGIEFAYEKTSKYGGGVDNDVIVSMLQNLPEEKADRLPNLKTIDFELMSCMFMRKDQALLRACRNASVQIKAYNKLLN